MTRACPRDALLLFLRRKSNQKAAGGVPPAPRHRPPGDTPFVVYLPFAVAGLILPEVPALRLPLPSVYPQVLTGSKQRGECGADLPRSDSVGPPCRGYPFKRPAGVQWPTATSNPKPPVAARGRSWMRARPPDQNPEGLACSRGTAALHLGACAKVPRRGRPPFGRPREGFLGRSPKRFFRPLLGVQKRTPGHGAGQAPETIDPRYTENKEAP